MHFSAIHCIYFLVPSAAPSDISVTNVLSTTIELMWGEVPENNRNGIITEYNIRFRQLTFETNHYNWVYMTVPASNLTTQLTGLLEYVTYYIQISASTSVGIGPFSDEVNTTTLEDCELTNCLISVGINRDDVLLYFSL